MAVHALFFLFLAAPPWPGFHGPSASGYAAAGFKVPLSWNLVTGANVGWQKDVPGLSHGSPVVAKDRVFLLTAVPLSGASMAIENVTERVKQEKNPGEQIWRLLCYTLHDGKLLWDQEVDRAVPRFPRHVRATFSNTTPAVSDEVVAVVTGSMKLAVFDHKGTKLWMEDMGAGLPDLRTGQSPYLDPASSPVIFEDVVVVQNDWYVGGHVAAWNLRTGKQLWRKKRVEERMGWSTPVVTPKGELILNSEATLRAHNVRMGEELWTLDDSVKQPYNRIASPLALPDGSAILTGGGPEKGVYAIKPGARGDLLASKQGVTWKTERHGAFQTSPAADATHLYMIAENGVLRLKDGSMAYEKRVVAGATFSASPVIAGGYVYLIADEGVTYVVKAGEQFEVKSTNPGTELTLATPAIAGKTLLIRTVSKLIAVRET